jgi:hypothetical protein
MVIKSIGPLSVGKVAGTLYAAMGVLFGAIVSLITMGGARALDPDGSSPFGALFGVGAIVLFPILYGVIGFLFSMLFAVLYNVVAGIVGGIEVDVQ